MGHTGFRKDFLKKRDLEKQFSNNHFFFHKQLLALIGIARFYISCGVPTEQTN